MEVSKFATLLWHSQRESQIRKNDLMSTLKSFIRKWLVYIDSISATFKNSFLINSC